MSGEKPVKQRLSVGDWFDGIKIPFNRFFLFLLLVVALAAGMGLISFQMYRLSDAANLDLSLPDYREVRESANNTQAEPKVDLVGPVDAKFKQDVLDDLKYYQKQIGDGRAFSAVPLADETLISIDGSIQP